MKKLILMAFLLNTNYSFSQLGKYNLIVTQAMSPSTGISSGDIVQITLTVEHPNYSSCDSWINGVFLDFGSGYDELTVNYVSSPASKWITASNASDMPVGAIGWGYDHSNNGSPFLSWGKSGNGPYNFVLEIEVASVANISDLDIGVYYYGDFDTGAYSGGNCGSVNNPDGPYLMTPASVLPIKLLSFDGYEEQKGNLLTWITETEINNDYFEVEKSYDAVNFEIINTVEGAGNSDNIVSYETIDSNPYVITYYRLTQVDYDGKKESFNIIAVRNKRQNKNSELLYRTSVSGQVVSENYYGLVIEHYNNNVTVKKLQISR